VLPRQTQKKLIEVRTAGEQSLGNEVYLEVLRRIINGEYPGGYELKTTQLARELGVSRTPVLFALSRLISDGIAAQRRNMRAVVNIDADNWLLDVHELRLLLEPTAAALAAERITDEVLANLEALTLAAKPRKSRNWIKKGQELDFVLHLSIADHTGNEALRQAIYKCWQYKGLAYLLGADSPDLLGRSYPEHVVILDALKARQSEQAAALMKEHLRNVSLYRLDPKVV
jgi:DNA-binding GntR family transcriptional regulator